MELSTMNPAAMPPVVLGFTQRNRYNSGLKKTPPPMPVSPARNPSTAPTSMAMGQKHFRTATSSVCQRERNSKTSPATVKTAPSTSL